MNFDQYQAQASKTDQFDADSKRGESISLFGLIGEVGSLLTVFKKRLRDKNAYQAFTEDMIEEMGDVLWYLANLATKYRISLADVASKNLEKTAALWAEGNLRTDAYKLFDETFPSQEQLPRDIDVTFNETGQISDSGFKKVEISMDGMPLGAQLTDNSWIDDGYRFHDCFHLSYAAVLGWSPVLRRMQDRKRKSNAAIDEIEDGARASFTEEFISIYVYSYAKKHNFFEGTKYIDGEVLRTIRNLVRGLEVEVRSAYEWRAAILKGFEVFRKLRKGNGGTVNINLNNRTISVKEE